MKLETKLKKWGIRNWKRELDRVYSLYVRNKYADHNGMVKCYTCNRVDYVEKMHCGHFNPRQYLSTRWRLENTKPQCPTCNTYNNGQPAIFAERLSKEYGPEILTELSKDNFKPIKLDAMWYHEQIEHYKKLLEGLERPQNAV